MSIKQKMVILPEAKALPIRGGMFGPITTPHMISVEDIKLMLFYGTEVLEVIEGGKHVKLTEENYNKDNSVVAIPAQQRKVEEPKAEIKDAKKAVVEKQVKTEQVQPEQQVEAQQAPKQEKRK